MKCKRHKGECHHKRHGKNDRVHIGIISHFGQLQQFCYNSVTLLCPVLTDTAGHVPVHRIETRSGIERTPWTDIGWAPDDKAGSEPKTIMPLLKLETTVALSDEKKKALLASLSKIVAGTIGKPEQYVMVVVSPTVILMSGKPGDAAFVDIRSIGGLNDNVNRQLSQKIGSLLNESLGVPPDRIYLTFTDVAPGNWGWNGDTFG